VARGRSDHDGAAHLGNAPGGQAAIEVFKSLEADTGLSTGWEPTGTLHLATNADRWEELKRQASTSKHDEIDVEVLDVAATLERWPLLSDDGLVGSLFYPGDGRGNATDTTMSLSRGARQRGVQIFENTPATGIRRDGTRVTGVEAGGSVIECEYVVDCGGMWGREIAALAGVQVPLQALAHYYVVTEAIPGLARGLPTIKSSDDWMYVKNEGDGLMVGFFEPGSYPWQSQGIPGDAAFVHLPEDWDHLGPFYEQAMHRIPALATAGIRLFFGGPESFTPDGVYHCGEAPNLQNFFVAAGFNSTGFLTGPGIGSVLADWLRRRSSVDRSPRGGPSSGDAARDESSLLGTAGQRDPRRRLRHALAVSATAECSSAAAQSAVRAHRGERCRVRRTARWERPNWYAPDGVAREYVYSYGRQNWFEHSAAEHRAVRDSVGVFDISTYGKFLVQGRDALQTLQRISVADVDVECGRIVYTQWLNRFGGIEADLTVTRLGEREFLVLSAPATAVRDLAWIRRHIADDEFTTVADVSGTMAMIAVMGPASRELLQPLTDCDLSNEAFPFATSREIDLGLGFVRATRITYVGELGWELLVPHDIAAHIYDVVIDAGARPAGYHALNSLRIEKGYRSWGHDISSGDHRCRPGSGSPLRGTSRVGSSVATRWSTSAAPVSIAASCNSCSTTRSHCCSTESRSHATASASVTSPQRCTATPSARRSAWGTCTHHPPISHATGSPADASRLRWPAGPWRHVHRCNRCTTRRRRARGCDATSVRNHRRCVDLHQPRWSGEARHDDTGRHRVHTLDVLAHRSIHRLTVSDVGEVDDDLAEMFHGPAGLLDQLTDVLHHLVGLLDRIGATDVGCGVEILRALAAQEDHGAACDHRLTQIVVEVLLRIRVLRVELADASVSHRCLLSIARSLTQPVDRRRRRAAWRCDRRRTWRRTTHPR
jgi:4-methylaminobutanoate oxidase (formaldehyde-forming)